MKFLKGKETNLQQDKKIFRPLRNSGSIKEKWGSRISIQKVKWTMIFVSLTETLLMIIFGVLLAMDHELLSFTSNGWFLFVGLGIIISFKGVFSMWYVAEIQSQIVQIGTLEDSLDHVGDLNDVLRAQRHDFLNHLQVVYGLMEMEEYAEASGYIHQVYSDIRSVSSVLRTDSVPVNALLQAKMQAAAENDIYMEISANSSLEELPVEEWQMCRILANLIDNGMQALNESGRAEKRIWVRIDENIDHYIFSIANDGPMIQKEDVMRIFQAGFTTRLQGHGMGLSIVENIVKQNKGQVELKSDPSRTEFAVWIPKRNQVVLREAHDS